MSGVLLGSLLEEAVKKLPKALKPEAVVPTLKKAGVKDEELQLSGIGVKLPEYLQALPKDDKGRIAGQEVADFTTAFRTDSFSMQDLRNTRNRAAIETQYAHITLPQVMANPAKHKYKERIYQFKSPNSVSYGSSHFASPDYLMHTRIWDDELDGLDTRVVGEVQSDLHQKDKTRVSGHSEETIGYINQYLGMLKDRPQEQDSYAKMLRSAFEGANTGLTKAQRDAKVEELLSLGLNGADKETIGKAVREAYAPKQKEAPWKTSWARKGLENEIKQAISEGKKQIAVPIKNASGISAYSDSAVAELRNIDLESIVSEFVTSPNGRNLRDVLKEQSRSESEDVLNALDVAGDLIEDRLRDGETIEDLYLVEFFTDDFIDMLRELNPPADNNPIGSMVRSPGVQKWYETNVAPTVQKLAKQLGTNYKTVEKDGVEYAVIDLTQPGVKEKADSAFKLYAGGGVLAYYLAAAQGYTPSEISGYMEEQGFSEDEIANAKANWKKAREAKKAGKSDDEINAMFDTQLTIKE